MVKFTKRQWTTLLVIAIADFCNAVCVSLQAPFYPHVAESKNCTATEYGLVFGIFELVVFLVSPLFGKYVNKIGPKRMFNSGLYTIGICAILFGTLDNINDRYPFIILSFIIRITEAMGNAGFLTASFAIIAVEFPQNIATTFACLETFFGFGLIVGPLVGGVLYQAGGYTLPFAVMGSLLCLASVFTTCVLPVHLNRCDEIVSDRSMFSALRIPSVFLAIVSVASTSMSIGFLQATLEPHLREFNLNPITVGLMFVINGVFYAATTPVYGFICDRSLIHPKKITILGCVFVAVGFTLIGPLPILPLEKSIGLIIGGLVLHGFGMGAQLVSSFSDALRTSVAHGFPDNVDTYGLISGLWTSSFALGAFIGPSISGALFDIINFPNASTFVIVVHIVVGLIVIMYLCYVKQRRKYTEIGKDGKPINGQNSITESMKSVHVLTDSISIEKSRPPAMNSLIACNSNVSQIWHNQKDPHNLNFLLSDRYSYGSMNQQSMYTC